MFNVILTIDYLLSVIGMSTSNWFPHCNLTKCVCAKHDCVINFFPKLRL